MSGKIGLLRLYASLLRLHREKLPFQLRDVGDQYLKEEFRAFWKLPKGDFDKYEAEFRAQWRKYASTMEGKEEESGSAVVLMGLSDDQKDQLKRLKDEIDGLGRTE